MTLTGYGGADAEMVRGSRVTHDRIDGSQPGANENSIDAEKRQPAGIGVAEAAAGLFESIIEATQVVV